MTLRQAGGVVLWGDRVVLRRTQRGEWVFPKGHIDPGETPEQAALREVLEETGLASRICGPADSFTFLLDGEECWVDMYLMKVLQATPEWDLHRGRDAEAHPWQQVASLLTFENTRTLWQEVLPQVFDILADQQD